MPAEGPELWAGTACVKVGVVLGIGVATGVDHPDIITWHILINATTCIPRTCIWGTHPQNYIFNHNKINIENCCNKIWDDLLLGANNLQQLIIAK